MELAIGLSYNRASVSKKLRTYHGSTEIANGSDVIPAIHTPCVGRWLSINVDEFVEHADSVVKRGDRKW